MRTSTYPVVPEGPLTLKLNSLLVELKESIVIVEFEVTEKTFWSDCIETGLDGVFSVWAGVRVENVVGTGVGIEVGVGV